jgi:DNA-binding transcriptional LysR family regulator
MIWSTPRSGASRPVADDSFEDKIELVAAGHSIAILPAGDRRSTLRDDLATIPLEGIEPCQVVLASLTDDQNPMIATFRAIARTHLAAAGRPGAGS